jgi:phage portal protein BeeE
MPGLLDRIIGGGERKAFSQPNFWTLPDMFSTAPVGASETVENNFAEYVTKLYKANGIVAACIGARMLPFSEARFQYQEIIDGRPGRLFDGPGLDILATPWTNATTGDLLSRMEQEGSIAGNSYWTPVNGRLRRMRPDWVKILSGVAGDPDASPFELEAEILAYIYHPTTTVNGRRPDPVVLTPDRVVHYAPIPDPLAQWRGMSWLTPIVREIQADTHATKHKLAYFENGTALNVVIKYDASVKPDDLPRYQAIFDQAHKGSGKAYKTLHLGGGADASVLGADLKSIDFKAVQGAGESRIAAAAGVGAIIARLSEGMQGSSLNQGNYGAAKRQFADMTLRPLWRSAAGSLAKIAGVPENARLWIDVRDVEFLKEDRKDAAEILQLSATTIRSLVDAGYDPDAVIDAVEADDLSRLTGKHSGLYSVQLQEPGSGSEPPPAEKASDPIVINAPVTVNVPETKAPDVHIDAPVTVNVPEMKAPDVTVNVPEVKAPNVTVNMPEPAPVEARATRKTIEHTPDGRIAAIIEEPA